MSTDSDLSLFERASEAAAAIRAATSIEPKTAVVLGSGLGHLTALVENPTIIPYAAIPHFPRPTVAGHAGNLVVGLLGGAPVAMLQGRVHFYEGHDLATVTFPTRVMAALGVKTMILTAATGGVNLEFHKGELVCLTDHINGLGVNPLRGPNDERFGKRFPDMSSVYSPSLRTLAHGAAKQMGLALQSGVYFALPGPSYETPAEIRMLRSLGADVVGMSTVPEAIVARHSGMDVLAFAMVTNAAAGVTSATIDHAEVIEVAEEAGQRLGRIIERVVKGLA